MKQRNNYVMKGASGEIAQQAVFKQVYGQTVIARHAKPRAFDSPAQVVVKEIFTMASEYAVAILCDPDIEAIYSSYIKGHLTAYNIAIHDIYDTPVIETILTRDYTGRGGSIITLFAQKNNFVAEMLVTIKDADGVVIESGYAVQAGRSTEWNYTPTQHNAHIEGSTIIVEAADYAGNKGEFEKEVTQKKRNNTPHQQQGAPVPAQHYLKPIASRRLLPGIFIIPYADEYVSKKARAARQRDVGLSGSS